MIGCHRSWREVPARKSLTILWSTRANRSRTRSSMTRRQHRSLTMLQRHMQVVKTKTRLLWKAKLKSGRKSQVLKRQQRICLTGFSIKESCLGTHFRLTWQISMYSTWTAGNHINLPSVSHPRRACRSLLHNMPQAKRFGLVASCTDPAQYTHQCG